MSQKKVYLTGWASSRGRGCAFLGGLSQKKVYLIGWASSRGWGCNFLRFLGKKKVYQLSSSSVELPVSPTFFRSAAEKGWLGCANKRLLSQSCFGCDVQLLIILFGARKLLRICCTLSVGWLSYFAGYEDAVVRLSSPFCFSLTSTRPNSLRFPFRRSTCVYHLRCLFAGSCYSADGINGVITGR